MDWRQFFENAKTTKKSAYDFLIEVKAEFEAPQSTLKMDIESTDGYLDMNTPKPVALYLLHIKAPLIGNYRIHVLTTAEFSDEGRFPVEIVNHFDNDNKIENITEDKFQEEIEKILKSSVVKRKIEDLYRFSLERQKRA